MAYSLHAIYCGTNAMMMAGQNRDGNNFKGIHKVQTDIYFILSGPTKQQR